MGIYTTEQIKTLLESGIAVFPTPSLSGDFLSLCPDGSVFNRDGQIVGGADTVRAQLYDKFSIRHAPIGGRLFYLGAPAVSDNDKIVESTNMKNGEYTLTASPDPDVPRNILVTVTAGSTADTMGTITIFGIDYHYREISEVIVPSTSAPVAGKLAFREVYKVVGEGWEIDDDGGTNDTIKIGYGNKIGLPVQIGAAADVLLGILGTTIAAATGALSEPASLAGSTVDMSASTYDGSKKMYVFVKC